MASHGKVILSYHNTLLRESDIELLEGPYWLNDIVISFWLEFLENQILSDHLSHIAFVSPQVSQFLKMCAESEVGLMLDSLEIKSKKLILLPVNDNDAVESVGGCHWSLLIFRPSLGFVHYDSYAGSNIEQAELLATALASYLDWDLKKKPLKRGECPSQTNSYDCGIHVLCNVERICCSYLSELGKCVPSSLDPEPKTKRTFVRQIISNLAENKTG